MFRNPKNILTIFVFLLGLYLNNFGQNIENQHLSKPDKPPQPISRPDILTEKLRRIQTFEIVWQTINDNYFDQTFNGLDWKKIKTEYEKKVVLLQTDEQLHLLLQEMIGRLDRSHFSIIPPEVVKEFEKVKAETEIKDDTFDDEFDPEDLESDLIENNEQREIGSVFGIGIEIRIFNNQVVISRVEKNSPAEMAGLQPGFIIEKINGISLREFIEKIKTYGSFSKSIEKQIPLGIIAWLINSRVEKPLIISYLDESSKQIEIEIQRKKLDGELVNLIQNLPKQFFTFQTDSINEEIGYIKFNIFTLDLIEKFCQAISVFKDKKAIIIDLRGNLGGSLGALYSISGLLTDKNLPLGTEIYKVGREKREIKSHKKNYKGRIVILIDGQSYSAAEIFSAALQENKKATIIGERSAGEALPALTKILPTGAIFLFPIANFQTPKGNLIEGQGIEPDISIPLKREDLLKGNDLQFESAVDFINKSLKQNDNKTAEIVELKKPPLPPPKKIGMAVKQKPETVFNQNEKALSIISDSINALGGEVAIRNVKSYSASGTAKFFRSGAEISGSVAIYRTEKNFWAEVLEIVGVGQIREVFNGDKYFIQSKILGTEFYNEEARVRDAVLFADLYELLKIREVYPKINYKGVFQRQGRDVQLIEAFNSVGDQKIFAFDKETKLLVNRTSKYSDVSYADYRKVGDILFPFRQTRTSAVVYQFTEVKQNVEIDNKIFLPEENCFDRVD